MNLNIGPDIRHWIEADVCFLKISRSGKSLFRVSYPARRAELVWSCADGKRPERSSRMNATIALSYLTLNNVRIPSITAATGTLPGKREKDSPHEHNKIISPLEMFPR